MARTAIPIFFSGDSFSGAQSVVYWRDNEAAHWPYTNVGDMAYEATINTLARLALGTFGQIIVAGATVPGYSGAAGCRISRTAVQSIPSGAITTLIDAFDAEIFDTNGFHAGVGSQIVIPANYGGYYIIGANIVFDSVAAASTHRAILLRINGATNIGIQSTQSPNGQPTSLVTVATYSLADAATVDLGVQQISGGNLDVIAAILWCMKIR